LLLVLIGIHGLVQDLVCLFFLPRPFLAGEPPGDVADLPVPLIIRLIGVGVTGVVKDLSSETSELLESALFLEGCTPGAAACLSWAVGVVALQVSEAPASSLLLFLGLGTGVDEKLMLHFFATSLSSLGNFDKALWTLRGQMPVLSNPLRMVGS
jgi:hypothetical protein